jgi:hypothetical protein
LHRLNEDLFEKDARMKATHYLSAIMLLTALSAAAATDVAVAKPRHPVSAEGSGHGSTSPNTEQKKSGDAPGGSVKNSNGGPANGNASPNTNTNVGDRGNPSSGGPPEDGPMKKGQGLPGKTSGKSSVGDAGKNQIDDTGDRNRRGMAHPGAKNATEHGAEPLRVDNVIVDHSGHKSKTQVVDTTKKVTTVSAPPAKGNQRPSGLAAIGGGDKNAIGLAMRNDKDPKLGKDAKIDAKPLDPIPPGPAGIKSNPITVTTNSAGHPGSNPNVPEGPTKIGVGLNGALISRPGSGPAIIGGPAKNIASINGTVFRPKRGR